MTAELTDGEWLETIEIVLSKNPSIYSEHVNPMSMLLTLTTENSSQIIAL
jgi:hypothetical protein